MTKSEQLIAMGIASAYAPDPRKINLHPGMLADRDFIDGGGIDDMAAARGWTPTVMDADGNQVANPKSSIAALHDIATEFFEQLADYTRQQRIDAAFNAQKADLDAQAAAAKEALPDVLS